MSKAIPQLFIYAICASGLIWLSNQFGLWWFTLVVGILLGCLLPIKRIVFVLALIAGLCGWGIPLLLQSLQFPLGKLATIVASLSGIGGSRGWLIFVATILLGVLLCSSGAWVGSALRLIVIKVLKRENNQPPIQMDDEHSSTPLLNTPATNK